MKELTRFFFVAFVGVAIDIPIAYAIATLFGAPLWIAATVGFSVAAFGNYILHETWTFQQEASRLSSKRALYFFITSCVTLLSRFVVMAGLSAWISPDHTLMILVGGVTFSFFINYVISKHFVFLAPRNSGKIMMNIHKDEQFDDSNWELPSFEEVQYATKQHQYALVIPVINEGERIREQLQRIHHAKLLVDVIIADGGSTDGSLDPSYMDEVAVTAVLTKTGEGKLSAQLRIAYAWCLRKGYRGIVTIDGNGKDGVEAIADMMHKLEDGYDYVQGSRYLPGGCAENTPLERTIANRVIHAPLLSIAGRHWFTDTTNGFRAYSARYLLNTAVQPFRNVFRNYELLFYLTVRAGQVGMKVAQIPVKRHYPHNVTVPTKISGVSAKIMILKQTFEVVLGKYSPKI